MKKRLLYTRLRKLSDRGTLRFHMPGHKGKICFENENWATLDTTEVPGADNLHDPSDILLRVQKKLAEAYGSEEACILVNGTTTGIQSAVMGVCREGESLLVPLNCHRSVYAGLALGRVKGIYFEPEYDARLGFGKRVTVEQVEEKLLEHPEVKGMIDHGRHQPPHRRDVHGLCQAENPSGYGPLPGWFLHAAHYGNPFQRAGRQNDRHHQKGRRIAASGQL